MRKAVREIAKTLLLLTVLFLGAEMPKSQAKATQDPVSHGNLIYEDARGSVSLYAADILLLEEKLSSIPERCFDPVRYAHTMTYEDEVVDACCFEEEEFAVPETDEPLETLETSGIGETPETAEIGEVPEVPEIPEIGEPPEISETPETDEPPEISETPETAEPPEISETPETAELPETPETSEVPEMEETPDAPETSETTDKR